MSFRQYLTHGWKLCAIPPGSKGPTGAAAKGWNALANAITNPAVGPQIAGAGLCHAWSGTCALDVDDYGRARAWLAERGVLLDDLMLDPLSVQISSGRQGRAKLIYTLPEPLASKKLAPYQMTSEKTGKPETYHAFELRCANADGLTVQDVLPPTIHPNTGQPYMWKYGDDLCGHWMNPPPLPAVLHTIWLEELAPRVAGVPISVAPVGAAFSEIRELLKQRDPDADYDTWLETGMVLHHETRGSQDGFAFWDTWSAKGSKYKGAADLATHWRSFRIDAPNPVTLRSLLRDTIAALDAFPITPEPSEEFSGAPNPNYGEDTRPGAELRRILETRLVFVVGQDCYYDMEAKSDAWLSDRSVRHLFCPKMPLVVSPGKDGKPDKVAKPDPVDFLKNSGTKTVVDAVGIHPGAPRLYIDEDNRRYVNRFMPRAVTPLAPMPQEMEAFNFLWSRMRDETFRRWLLKFYAHALQKPGVKIQSAPLLFSAAQGTGKNTIAKRIPELLFGSRWVRTMSGNVLAGQFNDVVGETWWLYLEELRSGSSKADRVLTTNKIKAWITDNTIEVHPKGMKPFDLPNRMQITATSNFDDAVQIDNNDRRWAICELGDPLTERESLDLYAFLNSDRAPGVLSHIFRNVDLTGFQPTARAPYTKAKTTMIRAGVGSWESMLIEHMIGGNGPFDRDVFELKAVHEQLLGRGPTSIHALSRVLKRAPFSCELLPRFRQTRLWAWRNIERWRRTTEGERLHYLQTGERPRGGTWTEEIPKALMTMSAEASEPDSDLPDSCLDLV